MARICLSFPIAILASSGCSVYHEVLFAHQDKGATVEEPWLLDGAPDGADSAIASSAGEFVAVHGKPEETAGRVELVPIGGDTYLHMTDWSINEGPDLYLYVSTASLETIEEDHAVITDPTQSVALTVANLRPSTLGLSGSDTWFLLPESEADAKSVVIHCLNYNKLFSGAALLQGVASE